MTINSVSSGALIQQSGTKSDNIIKENIATDKTDSSTTTLKSSTNIIEKEDETHPGIDNGNSEAAAQTGEPGSLLDVLA